MGNSTKKTRKRNLYIPSMKTLARKACPPGMIERKGYKRRYSSKVRNSGFTVKRANYSYKIYPKGRTLSVAARCVKNTSKPTSGVPGSIGPLRKGELSKYGYALKKSDTARHRALKLAVGKYGTLGVFRKLDAVEKLTENKLPEASKVYRNDKKWVVEKFGPLKTSGALS